MNPQLIINPDSNSKPERKIPFLNLKAIYSTHREEFQAAIERVLTDASFIGGEELEKFQTNFANWVSPGFHSVGCGNGTDAITLAAKALQLPVGSEAIVPAMTFVATVEGLLHAGLKVKLVDITPGNWHLNLREVEKAITPNTSLIVPVHLYGQMAPMEEVAALAKKYNLKILEDAAQAHGAKRNGKPIGFYGDIATYSFFPGKNLGCFGDGGAVLSKDKSIIDLTSSYGKHGGLIKYQHDRLGYNSRLDNVQAAILDIKLKYIDQWNDNRRKTASIYYEMLSDIPGLQLSEEEADAKHVYHLFVTLVEDRASFIKFLKEHGVETGVHYPKAIHELPVFESYDFAKQKFPVSEHLAKHGVSLPMCPFLRTEDAEYVAKTVKRFFK